MIATQEVLTVGQMVAQKPGWARVFERLGIDYCCGGKRPFGEACAAKGLDPAAVLAQLNAATERGAAACERDWLAATFAELVEHIVSVHHAYLRSELPRLQALSVKAAEVHGPHDPRLVQVAGVFGEMKAELEQHMFKEEHILFPMCLALEQARGAQNFHCGSIRNPIAMMEHEHDSAGGALAAMRELTDGFTPPGDACNTYRALLHGLAEVEADLHQHIHEENNVLFPRAIAREDELAGAK